MIMSWNMFLSQLVYTEIFGGKEYHVCNLLANGSEKQCISWHLHVYTHMRIGEKEKREDDKVNVNIWYIHGEGYMRMFCTMFATFL